MQDSTRLHKSCGPEEPGQQILGLPRKNFLLIPSSWSNCRAGWRQKGQGYKPTYREVNPIWQKLEETRSHLSFSLKTGSSQRPRESFGFLITCFIAKRRGNVVRDKDRSETRVAKVFWISQVWVLQIHPAMISDHVFEVRIFSFWLAWCLLCQGRRNCCNILVKGEFQKGKPS